MGISFCICYDHTLILLLEPPQMCTFLLRIFRFKLIRVPCVATNLRINGVGIDLWPSCNAGCFGCGGSGIFHGMDHCACFAEFLWEAKESFGDSREEANRRDHLCGVKSFD